jgi:hypothetical protein
MLKVISQTRQTEKTTEIRKTKKAIFMFFLSIGVSLMFLLLLVDINVYADNTLTNQKVLGMTLQNRYEKHERLEKYKKHEFIFFYNATCKHCTIFCKTLKDYAANHRISVTAFKLTRESSYYFPNSVLVDQNTIDQYFGEGVKMAVPTLFILNPTNMYVYPVSRGNLTYAELTIRMNDLMQNIKRFEIREHVGKKRT